MSLKYHNIFQLTWQGTAQLITHHHFNPFQNNDKFFTSVFKSFSSPGHALLLLSEQQLWQSSPTRQCLEASTCYIPS